MHLTAQTDIENIQVLRVFFHCLLERKHNRGKSQIAAVWQDLFPGLMCYNKRSRGLIRNANGAGIHFDSATCTCWLTGMDNWSHYYFDYYTCAFPAMEGKKIYLNGAEYRILVWQVQYGIFFSNTWKQNLPFLPTFHHLPFTDVHFTLSQLLSSMQPLQVCFVSQGGVRKSASCENVTSISQADKEGSGRCCTTCRQMCSYSSLHSVLAC